MIDCWADKLGDCSNKQSKEHIVSKILLKKYFSFENNKIWGGYGLPWSEEKSKKISIDSAAAKILCTHHNNLLSPLDATAEHAFTIFEELWSEIYNAKLTRNKENISCQIDGILFERWFLKTAINYIYITYDVEKPPIELIELAFGKKKFPKNVGLCIAATSGWQEFKSVHNDLKTLVIEKDDTILEIVLYGFCGWKFALPLSSSPLPKSLNFIKTKKYDDAAINNFIKDFLESDLFHHLPQINIERGNSRPMEIKFDWDSSNPDQKNFVTNFDGWSLRERAVLHIYRPKAIDAEGNWVWCEIDIDKPIDPTNMRVTIPQQFLDKAVYPVKIVVDIIPK